MDGLRKCMIIVLIILLPTLLHAGQTTFANSREVVHKGSGGMSTATVPDVTLTPAVPAPVPVPYPNISQDPGSSIKNPTVGVKEPSTTKVKTPATKFTIKEPALSPTIKSPALVPTLKEPTSSITIREPFPVKAPVVSPPIKAPVDSSAAGTSDKELDLFQDSTVVGVGDNIVAPGNVMRRISEPVPSAKAGIIPGHAYTVLGTVTNAEGEEYVVLRNPWGESAPTAGEVTPEIRGELKNQLAELARSGDADIMANLFEVFSQSVDTQNQDKAYWINKLKQQNDIAEALGDYLKDLNDAAGFPGEGEIPETVDEEGMESMSFMELQQQVQMQSRQYQTISNALKASHDIANSSIRNTRGGESSSEGSSDSAHESTESGAAERKQLSIEKKINVRTQKESVPGHKKGSEGQSFGRKISVLMKTGNSKEISREIKTYMAELEKPGADRSFYVSRLHEANDISETVISQVTDMKGRKFSIPQALKVHDGMSPREMSRQLQRQSGFLDNLIKEMEEQLNTIGNDAQLANLDLQNMLQKQQQAIQMLSNVSKVLHDTALAVIRKIG